MRCRFQRIGIQSDPATGAVLLVGQAFEHRQSLRSYSTAMSSNLFYRDKSDTPQAPALAVPRIRL